MEANIICTTVASPAGRGGAAAGGDGEGSEEKRPLALLRRGALFLAGYLFVRENTTIKYFVPDFRDFVPGGG